MSECKPRYQNILTIVSAIGSIFTIISFTYTLVSYLAKITTPPTIVLLTITITLLIITVFAFIISKDKFSLPFLSWIMNLTATDCGFKFKKSIGTYEYISATEMKLTREFEIKVTRNGFNGFPIQYKWTGATETPAKITQNGQKLERCDEDYRDGQQHYKLTFDDSTTSYNKGDKVPKMGFVVGPMKDENKLALPYLSTSIPFPTESLLIQFIYPRSLISSPNDIRKLIYLHSTDIEHFKSDESGKPEFHDNERDIIKWEIKRPIVGAKYVIKWNFKQ